MLYSQSFMVFAHTVVCHEEALVERLNCAIGNLEDQPKVIFRVYALVELLDAL